MVCSSPIVVLDSGLGGLTVVQSLRRAIPQEDIVYFGDTARLPYGSKTASTVTTFVRQIINYLQPLHPKHVVIACNTATALVLPGIRGEFPNLSISGVIEPGARAAIEAAGNRQAPAVGIIATEATIRSQAYNKAILRQCSHARLITQATPLLVPIIEEGRSIDDPLVQLALAQYLDPLMKAKMDVLVLGCTHYPILKGLIKRMVGQEVSVIDSADKCAEDVAQRLRNNGQLAADQGDAGTLRCFVTDNSPRFAALGSRFLGMEIEPPTLVSPDVLYSVSSPVVAVAPMRPAI